MKIIIRLIIKCFLKMQKISVKMCIKNYFFKFRHFSDIHILIKLRQRNEGVGEEEECIFYVFHKTDC